MRVSCQHFTDCGLFLNGVGLGSRYEWTYTSGVWLPLETVLHLDQLRELWRRHEDSQFALASMDVLQVGFMLCIFTGF